MPVAKIFTVEQKRALVYEYLDCRWGTKSEFRRARGISTSQMRTWRVQVMADTLDTGLVPRGGVAVGADEAKAMARLAKEAEQLREQLVQERAEHAKALAAKEAELGTQQRAVDALGKAIEILHLHGAGKTSPPGGAPDPSP